VCSGAQAVRRNSVRYGERALTGMSTCCPWIGHNGKTSSVKQSTDRVRVPRTCSVRGALFLSPISPKTRYTYAKRALETIVA
jgi:hypothetical protein